MRGAAKAAKTDEGTSARPSRLSGVIPTSGLTTLAFMERIRLEKNTFRSVDRWDPEFLYAGRKLGQHLLKRGFGGRRGNRWTNFLANR